MKKSMLWALVLILILGASGCGYPEKTAKIPDTWPTYRVEHMLFPAEAGWSASDANSFAESAASPFQLLESVNQATFLACMKQPSVDENEHANYLALSYYDVGEEVSDQWLEEQVEALKNLKSVFMATDTTTFILNYPEIGQYGNQVCGYFSARLTLADGSKVVAEVGLTGHGNNLYQFTFLNYRSTEDTGVVARILSGLKWD